MSNVPSGRNDGSITGFSPSPRISGISHTGLVASVRPPPESRYISSHSGAATPSHRSDIDDIRARLQDVLRGIDDTIGDAEGPSGAAGTVAEGTGAEESGMSQLGASAAAVRELMRRRSEIASHSLRSTHGMPTSWHGQNRAAAAVASRTSSAASVEESASWPSAVGATARHTDSIEEKVAAAMAAIGAGAASSRPAGPPTSRESTQAPLSGAETSLAPSWRAAALLGRLESAQTGASNVTNTKNDKTQDADFGSGVHTATASDWQSERPLVSGPAPLSPSRAFTSRAPTRAAATVVAGAGGPASTVSGVPSRTAASHYAAPTLLGLGNGAPPTRATKMETLTSTARTTQDSPSGSPVTSAEDTPPRLPTRREPPYELSSKRAMSQQVRNASCLLEASRSGAAAPGTSVPSLSARLAALRAADAAQKLPSAQKMSTIVGERTSMHRDVNEMSGAAFIGRRLPLPGGQHTATVTAKASVATEGVEAPFSKDSVSSTRLDGLSATPPRRSAPIAPPMSKAPIAPSSQPSRHHSDPRESAALVHSPITSADRRTSRGVRQDEAAYIVSLAQERQDAAERAWREGQPVPVKTRVLMTATTDSLMKGRASEAGSISVGALDVLQARLTALDPMEAVQETNDGIGDLPMSAELEVREMLARRRSNSNSSSARRASASGSGPLSALTNSKQQRMRYQRLSSVRDKENAVELQHTIEHQEAVQREAVARAELRQSAPTTTFSSKGEDRLAELAAIREHAAQLDRLRNRASNAAGSSTSTLNLPDVEPSPHRPSAPPRPLPRAPSSRRASPATKGKREAEVEDFMSTLSTGTGGDRESTPEQVVVVQPANASAAKGSSKNANAPAVSTPPQPSRHASSPRTREKEDAKAGDDASQRDWATSTQLPPAGAKANKSSAVSGPVGSDGRHSSTIPSPFPQKPHKDPAVGKGNGASTSAVMEPIRLHVSPIRGRAWRNEGRSRSASYDSSSSSSHRTDASVSSPSSADHGARRRSSLLPSRSPERKGSRYPRASSGRSRGRGGVAAATPSRGMNAMQRQRRALQQRVDRQTALRAQAMMAEHGVEVTVRLAGRCLPAIVKLSPDASQLHFYIERIAEVPVSPSQSAEGSYDDQPTHLHPLPQPQQHYIRQPPSSQWADQSYASSYQGSQGGIIPGRRRAGQEYAGPSASASPYSGAPAAAYPRNGLLYDVAPSVARSPTMTSHTGVPLRHMMGPSPPPPGYVPVPPGATVSSGAGGRPVPASARFGAPNHSPALPYPQQSRSLPSDYSSVDTQPPSASRLPSALRHPSQGRGYASQTETPQTQGVHVRELHHFPCTYARVYLPFGVMGYEQDLGLSGPGTWEDVGGVLCGPACFEVLRRYRCPMFAPIRGPAYTPYRVYVIIPEFRRIDEPEDAVLLVLDFKQRVDYVVFLLAMQRNVANRRPAPVSEDEGERMGKGWLKDHSSVSLSSIHGARRPPGTRSDAPLLSYGRILWMLAVQRLQRARALRGLNPFDTASGMRRGDRSYSSAPLPPRHGSRHPSRRGDYTLGEDSEGFSSRQPSRHQHRHPSSGDAFESYVPHQSHGVVRSSTAPPVGCHRLSLGEEENTTLGWELPKATPRSGQREQRPSSQQAQQQQQQQQREVKSLLGRERGRHNVVTAMSAEEKTMGGRPGLFQRMVRSLNTSKGQRASSKGRGK